MRWLAEGVIFGVFAGKTAAERITTRSNSKRRRHGIYALIGCTYSKAMDTGFSDGLGSISGATYFPLPNWQSVDWDSRRSI